MKKSEIFPSKYLRAEDLPRPVTVTIERAMMEMLKTTDGKEQEKMVLYFAKARKGLVLNLTNYTAIADLYGDETDDWAGRRVEVFPTQTPFGNKTVACVRVRAPAQRELSAVKATPAYDEDVPFNDEVPL